MNDPIESTAHAAAESAALQSVEGFIILAVQWLKLGVEVIGAALVAIGVVLAVAQFAKVTFSREAAGFTPIRLTLARYLALALEFQLGADILSTAIAPSWEQIGKLGAIAVIRTGLNHFLSKEMREGEEMGKHERRLEERQNAG